jgi:hypothetical protein
MPRLKEIKHEKKDVVEAKARVTKKRLQRRIANAGGVDHWLYKTRGKK